MSGSNADVNGGRYRRSGGAIWRRDGAGDHGGHKAGEVLENLIRRSLLRLMGDHELLLLLLTVVHELL